MNDAFFARNASTILSVSQSLREQVLTLLRQGLVTEEIAPGEIYSAVAVANQLGVSASPVREAMLTLVSEGLMEPVRNRGYRVVPLSQKDRLEIYQLRLMLEPNAMGMLASSGAADASALAPLEVLARRTVDCAVDGDVLGHLESDRRFHLGLMELVGNTHLTEIVMRLRDQTRRFYIRSMPREQLISNAEEHFEILQALLSGKADVAESTMIGHLKHLGVDRDDEDISQDLPG